jgi:hypothetical protein
MKAGRPFWVCGLTFILWYVAGCGGGSSNVNNPPPQIGSSAISLTLRDAPPAGVAVLSFEITLTSAVLQPGNVALLNTPIEIEITRLEVETAFLNTANVPAGNYTSIALTFSNPELTILNNSGGSVGSCASGQVCELKPSLNPATATYSGAPFPLNLGSNSPMGLLVDFDLAASIQSDLSLTPSFSLQHLPPAAGTGQLHEMEDLLGRVSAKDTANNQFTLERRGRFLTVKVDANTVFEDFDEISLPNSFASLAVGQTVEVDVRLMAGGVLQAKKVELETANDELEGVIVAVPNSTSFRMVVREEMPNIAGVEVGNVVTVGLQEGTSFRVDNDGFTLPAGAQFSSASDLMPGQSVDVRPALVSGTDPIVVSTNRVRLRMSRFTATVLSVTGDTFVVFNLPPLFAGAGVTNIQVQTGTRTEFEGVSGVSGLSAGNIVSLRGLLFRAAGTPILVASKVRKR